MADNSSRTPGTGETIRTKDKSGIKSQVFLLDVGGSNTEKLLGDSGVSIPVADSTLANLLAAGLEITTLPDITVVGPTGRAYASVVLSASAGQTLVAANGSKVITLLAALLVGAGDGTITFLSNTTAKSGAMDFKAASGFVLPESLGWVETAAGEALKATVTGSTLNGLLVYKAV